MLISYTETKIDESFTTAQFILPGCHKPYWLDTTDKQGGLLVYIKSHLRSRLLSIHNTANHIQVIPCELNLILCCMNYDQLFKKKIFAVKLIFLMACDYY